MRRICKRVAAGIVFEGDRFLIAKKNSGLKQWEFPGGKIEPGETPEAALKRELYEELGMTVDVGALYATSRVALPDCDIELLAYTCRSLSRPTVFNDHERVEWILRSEVQSFEFSEADLPIVAKLASGR